MGQDRRPIALNATHGAQTANFGAIRIRKGASGQCELENRDIDPAIELVTDPLEQADASESKRLMKPLARSLMVRDLPDHDAMPQGAGQLQEAGQDHAANPAAMQVGENVDRILDGRSIGASPVPCGK